MACRVSQILTGCTSSHTAHRLSHPAKNMYESYCCVQILTIPAVDFIERTATSSSADPSMPHGLNVYPRCAGWQFTMHHFWKPQLFQTSLTLMCTVDFYRPGVSKDVDYRLA